MRYVVVGGKRFEAALKARVRRFSFAAEGEAGGEAGGAGARALKGVMRVGLLAKGLLLKGDRAVRLVVLCHDRPTVTLLKRVAGELPAHLARVRGAPDEPKYRVELLPADGAVGVSDGAVSVRVSLTSAVMREPAGESPPPASTPPTSTPPPTAAQNKLSPLPLSCLFHDRTYILRSYIVSMICNKIICSKYLPPARAPCSMLIFRCE